MLKVKERNELFIKQYLWFANCPPIPITLPITHPQTGLNLIQTGHYSPHPRNIQYNFSERGTELTTEVNGSDSQKSAWLQ